MIEKNDPLTYEEELKKINHRQLCSENHAVNPSIKRLWFFLTMCLPLGFFCLVLNFSYTPPPKLSELKYLSGKYSILSIIDAPREHKIKFRVAGEKIPFSFHYADYFPEIKPYMQQGEVIQLWVNKQHYNRQKSPQIWQLAIDGKLLVDYDKLSNSFNSRNEGSAQIGFTLIIIGSLAFLTKNKWE